MESKLQKAPHLKSSFLGNILSIDQEETIYWSKKLGIITPNIEHLFRDMKVSCTESDEDWGSQCSGSSQNSADSKPLIKQETTGINNVEKKIELEHDDYYKLPFSSEEILFVDEITGFKQCVNYLAEVDIIGLDAEHTASFRDPVLSTLQLSTKTKCYILDILNLKKLEDGEDCWKALSNIISNPDILIVGFGIYEDLKLLEKSVQNLDNLVQKQKNILCLEKLKQPLSKFIELNSGQVKGLSGLTLSVMGKKLDKSQQISNWDRRPLRQEQMIYAALDAYVCIQLYEKLDSLAWDKDKSDEFDKAVNDIITERKTKAITEKSKKKESSSKGKLEVMAVLNESPMPPNKFHVVCDTMLQGVCKKLRVCGVDAVALENGDSHSQCLAVRQQILQRGISPVYILSRGEPARTLSKHIPPGHCYPVQYEKLDDQIQEIFKYFNVVAGEGDLFSRCVICNGDQYVKLPVQYLKIIRTNLDKRGFNCLPAGAETVKNVNDFFDEESSDDEPVYVEKSEPKSTWIEVDGNKVDTLSGALENGVIIGVKSVPLNTLENIEEFWICYLCGKVYWQGSHWERAQNRVKGFLNVKPTPNPEPSQSNL